MSRARRSCLWLPLVALTLFFVACGWRNWHLCNDEDEVRLAIPGYYLNSASPSSQYTRTGGQLQPFEANHTTILTIENTPKEKAAPLSKALLQKLSRSYPQVRFVVPSQKQADSSSDDNCRFTFGRVRFQNKFTATCEATFITPEQGTTPYSSDTGVLTLTRSALPTADSNWRVIGWQWRLRWHF